jgi:murein DD-endopeptidase MepM/ murein hydrolase activator NlpD
MVESLDGLEQVTHRFRRGDTLGKLFKPFGLSREEKQSWFRSFRKYYSPKRLRKGREIKFFFSKNGSDRAGENNAKHLKALELDLNEDWVLIWERGNHGIVFSKRERPYETEIRTMGGTITDSVYGNGIRLGLNPTVISQFVDIFGWDVNFRTDVRSGDSFKVVYNRRYRKGSKNETFRILAAALINRGRKHFAFYFQKGNGEGNYYDLEGRSLARSFLRYPVEFSRISSIFSHVRFHPILKVKRPHRGVDFVAKRGSPVRAVGNGRVNYAGWKKGGYGRFIEIEHGFMLRTYYAHLQGFARGVRRGTKIKKGQIIGYVGCTGLCTGPHLHFELYKNRKYVNPLKIELPQGDRIESASRNIFENSKRLLLTELADKSRS